MCFPRPYRRPDEILEHSYTVLPAIYDVPAIAMAEKAHANAPDAIIK